MLLMYKDMFGPNIWFEIGIGMRESTAYDGVCNIILGNIKCHEAWVVQASFDDGSQS